MKKAISLLLLTLCLSVLLQANVFAQPTVYIVRHAEKWPGWLGGELGVFQPLSADGVETARRLAEQFKPGSLAAVFSSKTTRTQQTAFPVAQKLGLPLQVARACMDTSAIESFWDWLNQEFDPDQAVLLVTHSNLVPYLLIKAGLPKECRKAMGITSSPKHNWLIIEGYDHIWRLSAPGKGSKSCSDFSRTKF